jgi:ABC-type antimicrobial peptide transport system permease subunit
MTRALKRRKTKNITVIFAITLGVTILVGVQITSETLSETFLTSLLISQGENDLVFSPTTTGTYLNSSDIAIIQNISSYLKIITSEKMYSFDQPLGIMGVLLTSGPISYGNQFEPTPDFLGIDPNYDHSFGNFYDWKTKEILDINSLLGGIYDNVTIISSELAINLDIHQDNYSLPFTIETQFYNFEFNFKKNKTELVPFDVNLTVASIYDSDKPGIGALNNQDGRIVFNLGTLQNLTKGENKGVVDRLSAVYVTFKENHFTDGEFSRELLEGLVNKTLGNTPKFQKVDLLGQPVLDVDGKPIYEYKYTINSLRITFFIIADSIKEVLNSFLTTLGVLIIATGLLLITNIQLMSVEDREFQTGVLRAVGENRTGITRIYLLETIFQGVIGGIVGLGGGLLFGWTVAYYLSGLFGTGAGTVTPVVPVSLIIFSVLVGVLIAILTGLLPAIRASRVNIVEALRGIKIMFEEKSSRNFILLGLIILIFGIYVLLENGFINTKRQPIWDSLGWDTIQEQQTIIAGLGLIFTGLGTVLTRFIDRIKAINITAVALWVLPITAYLYTLEWVSSGSGGIGGSTTGFLLVSIIEIVIGSVLLIGLNLNFIMSILRNFLLKFKFFMEVGQISPAMIKSHKTRSTLTFAIFAVVLTLNVTIASLVATQNNSTIGKADIDSRGIDIAVSLTAPENTTYSYKSLIQSLNKDITDVIPFRTCSNCVSPSDPFYTYIYDPEAPETDLSKSILPLKLVEVTTEQIKGKASDHTDSNWRYDLYLNENRYPDEIRPYYNNDLSDLELLDLSRQSWDYLFNNSYTMAAYNLSIRGFTSGGGFGSSGGSLEGKEKLLDKNGSVIKNPIVFTDSFLLKLGQQIWIPMNTTTFGNQTVPIFQSYTIGGYLDRQRAAGFPFSSSGFDNSDNTLGSIFMTDYWTNMTNFFGTANSDFGLKRDMHQYDSFAIKTNHPINDPKVLEIAQQIEDFTNSKISGYRALINNNFMRATSITIWSKIKGNLEAINQITNFLQIYVSFGLVIGTLGMSVIAIRNVAERKREIGMMRAIGFPKTQVMLAVLLELFVLGSIGLVIGVSNGLIINFGLANLSNSAVVIPWDTIAIYLGFIAFVALLSGAIPGWVAARIPASEALRYTG